MPGPERTAKPRRRPSPWRLAGGFLQAHFRSVTGVLLAGLLGASVVLGVQWLQDPYRFPLRVVKVDGEYRHLDRERLQAVMTPFVEGGFFGVDVGSLCREVERLPWVKRVRIARDWPDRLRVTITEQVPVARWGEDGYLNAEAEAFYPREGERPAQLPSLAGPAGHERAVLERYRRIAKKLAPLGLAVSRVHLDARRAWRVETEDGLRLELGRADTWPRLQRFVKSWPTVLAGRAGEAERIDLRYSNGFSVSWQAPGPVADNAGKQRS